MGLLDYQEPFMGVQAKTATGVETLAVYGLSLEQAIFLARDYGEYIGPIYTEAREKGLTEERVAAVITDLLTEAPALINMVCFFGLRCKDDAEMDVVTRMPVGLRIEIVEAAATMTFHSENGTGKVMGIVSNVFKAAVAMAAKNAKQQQKA